MVGAHGIHGTIHFGIRGMEAGAGIEAGAGVLDGDGITVAGVGQDGEDLMWQDTTMDCIADHSTAIM